MAALTSPREKLIREMFLMLGGTKVKVDLNPEHLELCVDLAFDRYRQRSSNSVVERLIFLDLQPAQTRYVLPEEVVEVQQLYRRGTTGTSSGSGVSFDPFGAAFVNQSSVGLGSGSGSLLTYELYAGFQETVGRMFGLFINYTWESSTHTLELTRHIKAKETLLAQVRVLRSETDLLADIYARPWLRDWSVARAKIMMGEIRGKFPNIVGPQGGTSLNADVLKAEGEAEMIRLETEVSTQFEQSAGYGFVIG